jgi:hypothetical protein
MRANQSLETFILPNHKQKKPAELAMQTTKGIRNAGECMLLFGTSAYETQYAFQVYQGAVSEKFGSLDYQQWMEKQRLVHRKQNHHKKKKDRPRTLTRRATLELLQQPIVAAKK